MKKLALLLLSSLTAFSLLSGCASGTPTPGSSSGGSSASNAESSGSASEPESSVPASDGADQTIRITALKGPTAMGMVGMMPEAAENGYEFSIVASVDEITPKLIQGDTDMAAIPANMASVLYNNSQGQVQVLAVNTLGVLYIVENGESIQSIEDLRGKKIYASGKGATPEYALNYMLSANGINPETDVTIEYKSEHSECVAVIAQEENGIAMLPQPFVTTAQMKNENIRIALDVNKEWENAQDGSSNTLITGAFVVRTEFAKAHPEAVNAFLDRYKASVNFVNSSLDEASALIEQYDIVPAAVAQKALPYCNITLIEGTELKEKLGGYLSVLMEQNPKSIGGSLPDDAFYYSR